MADKSKFFCIAVEGGTTDGRVIERAWIDEMAAGYNTATYTARLNCEHLRGFSPEPPFNAYGSVLALEARDVELQLNGKPEKRRGLFAQIEPNAQLLAVNKKAQKLFTSCEISPNFGGTGKAGLVGLAITDSPASLGTEMLQFAATQGDKNPLAGRKQDKDNLFTAASEATIELDAGAAAGGNDWASSLKGILDGFASRFTTPKEEPKKEELSVAAPGSFDAAGFATALGETITAAIGAYATKTDATIATLSGTVESLKASIDTTDNNPGSRRPLATGGDKASFSTIDC